MQLLNKRYIQPLVQIDDKLFGEFFFCGEKNFSQLGKCGKKIKTKQMLPAGMPRTFFITNPNTAKLIVATTTAGAANACTRVFLTDTAQYCHFSAANDHELLENTGAQADVSACTNAK
jgi:hypothetical protein